VVDKPDTSSSIVDVHWQAANMKTAMAFVEGRTADFETVVDHQYEIGVQPFNNDGLTTKWGFDHQKGVPIPRMEAHDHETWGFTWFI
jgi:hypothetical protein